MKQITKDGPVPPAVLRQRDAATYCALSLRSFRTLCPVRPIELRGRGAKRPILLWRVGDLRDWLDALHAAPRRDRLRRNAS